MKKGVELSQMVCITEVHQQLFYICSTDTALHTNSNIVVKLLCYTILET